MSLEHLLEGAVKSGQSELVSSTQQAKPDEYSGNTILLIELEELNDRSAACKIEGGSRKEFLESNTRD